MTNPVLEIVGLTIDLPRGADRRHAVEKLDLRVEANEIVCIVGESGSGKSVTSFATMGLLPKALKASAGSILVDGRNVLSMTPEEHMRLRGRHIAMVFQEPMTALNPCFTVGNQIEEMFLAHTDLDADARRQRSLALIEEVHLPEPGRIHASYPHQLSGGQRQRIVIAIAIAMDPVLLIADEPTTALDVTTQAQILRMLANLRRKHAAGIVFVTHDFDVVADIADRVVVMEQGRIVEQGTRDAVLLSPKHPYTRKLISAVPKRSPRVSQVSASDSAQPAIEVRKLSKTFRSARTILQPPREVLAVAPVDFDVVRGRTLGIVGESGSGKSTLVKCLVRLLEPDTGVIRVNDVDIASLSRRELRVHRKVMQIVFQDPYSSLNPRRRIGEQIIEGAVNFGLSRSAALEKARELVKIVRLPADALFRFPSQFSGGQRQRICIARALMVDPEILIADEAVSALDVSVQKEVLELLQDIRQRMNLTMIFITHDLRVAAQVSDEIMVMSKGEVVERGSAVEVFQNPSHSYTKKLLDAMPGSNWDVPVIHDLEG